MIQKVTKKSRLLKILLKSSWYQADSLKALREQPKESSHLPPAFDTTRFLRNILKCHGSNRNSIAYNPTHRLLSAWTFIFRRYSCEKIEGQARALRGIFESAVLFGEGKCAENKNILPKNKTVLDTFSEKSIVKEILLLSFALKQKKQKISLI